MKTTRLTIPLIGLFAGTAAAQTTHSVGFGDKGLVHGTILDGSEYLSTPGSGFKFSVETQNNLDTAIIFDTRETGTADPDLEDPFVGGNLKGAELGNILIFADNLHGGGDGVVDNPNDSASGGDLTFEFNSSNVESFGMALVDAPESSETFKITFRDSKGTSRTLTLEQYISVSGTKGFAAGNNHANQFADTTARQLRLENIQSVDIELRGSGGFDNITWTESAVPEPSSALLMIAGLGMTLRRRR